MKIVKEIFSWACHLSIAFVVALLINIFIFQPTLVQGQSMEPTLHNEDKVLISKLLSTFDIEPSYGDIVIIDSRVGRPRTIKDDIADIFKYNMVTALFSKKPQDEIFWIKRVIGKPGDVLEFKNGKVIRNGSVLEETYINETMRYSTDKKVVVPEGHVFVMGDNRNHSSDSRVIGSVPFDHIVGKYVFKF
ncbi:MAG: signal peptidase I [Caloramator sp.]|nr:signal peptidase I [Caloramator sp.]